MKWHWGRPTGLALVLEPPANRLRLKAGQEPRFENLIELGAGQGQGQIVWVE